MNKSNCLLRFAIVAGLFLALPRPAPAQTVTTLHHFSSASGFTYTNSDGAYPTAGLILSGNTLFGTTSGGGVSGRGTVFRVNIDGTSFTNLHSFTMTFGQFSTNIDGSSPSGRLLLIGNTLFGVTETGGFFGNGTVYRVDTDGSAFTNLHSFSATPDSQPWINGDGASPDGGLVAFGNTLFGSAQFGGASGNGTLFALSVGGTGFTNLYSFSAGSGNWPSVTNSDGAFPRGSLVLLGSSLYGTAISGGDGANGTVFSVNTNGTGLVRLHSFTAAPGIPITNSDGAGPAGLILSGNTLYGAAHSGGSSGYGTIYSINTTGNGFVNLHSFPSALQLTNSEGAYPNAGLLLLGNTLYGTTGGGGRFVNLPGSPGNGTLFSISTSGTPFANLHDFTAAPYETNSDGIYPNGDLVGLGNDLYGTANDGGAFANGTVVKLSLPPQVLLTILRSGTNVVLSWPTNATGYSLQSATNLGSSLSWGNLTSGPVIIGNSRFATDSIAGPRKFYRLIH